MTDPRIAALAEALHRETWLSHGLPPEAVCGYCQSVAAKLIDSNLAETGIALPLGEPAMHAHDGLGIHRAEMHHRPEDYR